MVIIRIKNIHYSTIYYSTFTIVTQLSMSHSGSSGPKEGEAGRSRHPQYASGPYYNTGDGAERHQGRSTAEVWQYYASRAVGRDDARKTVSGKSITIKEPERF